MMSVRVQPVNVRIATTLILVTLPLRTASAQPGRK
jgi:hypothetical protein